MKRWIVNLIALEARQSDPVRHNSDRQPGQPGAIQSDALTLRIFVIRLVGSDLRARRFCRTWPNRPPNRRFYG